MSCCSFSNGAGALLPFTGGTVTYAFAVASGDTATVLVGGYKDGYRRSFFASLDGAGPTLVNPGTASDGPYVVHTTASVDPGSHTLVITSDPDTEQRQALDYFDLVSVTTATTTTTTSTTSTTTSTTSTTSTTAPAVQAVYLVDEDGNRLGVGNFSAAMAAGLALVVFWLAVLTISEWRNG